MELRNSTEVLDRLQRTLRTMQSSFTYAETYRNRVGIDAEALRCAPSLSTLPALLECIVDVGTEQFIMKSIQNPDGITSAIRERMTSNTIAVTFDESLTEYELNLYLNKSAQATRDAASCNVVHIINMRSEEDVNTNVAVLNADARYIKVDKAFEIFTTVTPSVTVKGFKATDPLLNAYIIVTRGLTGLVVDRILAAVTNDLLDKGAAKSKNRALFNELVTRAVTATPYGLASSSNNLSAILNNIFKDALGSVDALLKEEARKKMLSVLDGLKNVALDAAQEKLQRADNSLATTRNALMAQEEAYIAAAGAYELAKISGNAIKEDLQPFLLSMGDTLRDVMVSGTQIKIIADNTLTYFDSSALRPYQRNENSVLCRASLGIQNLITEVFVKRTVELRMTVGFSIDLITGSVNNVNHEYWRTPTYNGATDAHGIPNPHHYFYNCWGDNKNNISNAIRQNNYAEAVLLTYGATAGLNIADTTVFNKLIGALKENDRWRSYKCLYIKETKQLISIYEYTQTHSAKKVEIGES